MTIRTPFAPRVNHDVLALEAAVSSLYIGGLFTAYNQEAAGYFARRPL